MKKYILALLALTCSLVASAQNGTQAFLDWAKYNASPNKVTFSDIGNNSKQAVFSNISETGVNATVSVTSSSSSAYTARLAWLNHGYSHPYTPAANGNPYYDANTGLFFETNFNNTSDFITITIKFDQALDGLSYGLYGLSTAWSKSYAEAITNISATYNGDEVLGSIETTSGIRVAEGADSEIFYGVDSFGGNSSNDTGNLSVSYNGPVDTLSFTFKLYGDADHTYPNNSQQLGLGGIYTAGVYNPGGEGNIPEPSTTALLAGLVVLGSAIVLRRNRGKKA